MFVVTLPSSAAKNPQAFAKRAKEAGAELLEIRGDLTPNIAPLPFPLPLLVAPRGTGLCLVETLHPAYIDLDLEEDLQIPDDAMIIRSVHDHERTPALDALKTIAEKLLSQKPDILKIATTIRSYADIRTLEAIHAWLPSAQKRVIVGMGDKAHLTRMRSPLQNALTYTFVDGDASAAPGQVPLSLLNLTKHCESPRLFGLLGGPACVRSLSPLIHNTLLQRHNIDALYSIFPTDDLKDAWANLTALGIEAFSVTSPWKQEILGHLDAIEAEELRKNAINTAIKRDGKWTGYPRDAEGLIHGYPFLQDAASAAIIGSGGVIPEVVAACRMAGVRDIRIYARNAEQRSNLGTTLDIPHFPLEELAEATPHVLICAVSEDALLRLPAANPNAHAIDLRYARSTQFLEQAKDAGYAVHDGRAMLLYQALAQFQLFTGVTPTEEDVRDLQNLLSLP